MALMRRDGSRWLLASALGWSVTWSTGAALGVALGGYLTLTGGEGTPGASALDPTLDLVLLPLVAFATVLVVYVAGSLIGAALRGARSARDGRSGEHKGERPKDDRIGG